MKYRFVEETSIKGNTHWITERRELWIWLPIWSTYSSNKDEAKSLFDKIISAKKQGIVRKVLLIVNMP